MWPGVKSCARGRAGEFQGDLAEAAQVKFAGAEIGKSFDTQELIGTRFPERGEIDCGKLREDSVELFVRERGENDEALALLFVRDGGYGKDLFGGIGQFVQSFLELDVRNHFAADFAEAAEAVGDAEEAVFVHGGDIA